MTRSVSIHSGWPKDSELDESCGVTTRHLSYEGWVVFAHEGKNRRVAALLTQNWGSAMDYAHRWLMGESIEEVERNVK